MNKRILSEDDEELGLASKVIRLLEEHGHEVTLACRTFSANPNPIRIYYGKTVVSGESFEDYCLSFMGESVFKVRVRGTGESRQIELLDCERNFEWEAELENAYRSKFKDWLYTVEYRH